MRSAEGLDRLESSRTGTVKVPAVAHIEHGSLNLTRLWDLSIPSNPHNRQQDPLPLWSLPLAVILGQLSRPKALVTCHGGMLCWEPIILVRAVLCGQFLWRLRVSREEDEVEEVEDGWDEEGVEWV